MSHSRVEPTETNYYNVYADRPPTTLKTLGFAIIIIVGIGGLVAAGIGGCAYFHVCTIFSNISQIHAIIMMAAGGAGGLTFFVIGIIGSVKNCSHSKQNGWGINTTEAILSSINTQKGLVYGPD